jgi:hypothetical protein
MVALCPQLGLRRRAGIGLLVSAFVSCTGPDDCTERGLLALTNLRGELDSLSAVVTWRDGTITPVKVVVSGPPRDTRVREAAHSRAGRCVQLADVFDLPCEVQGGPVSGQYLARGVYDRTTGWEWVLRKPGADLVDCEAAGGGPPWTTLTLAPTRDQTSVAVLVEEQCEGVPGAFVPLPREVLGASQAGGSTKNGG